MIDQLSAWLVHIQLNQRFSSAITDLDVREVVLIRLRSQGIVGWGEAAPVPGHTTETAATLWANLNELTATRALTATSHATGLLSAALSQAKVDLAARLADKPLWRYLGGTNPVPASAAIGLDAAGQPDRSQITSLVAAGYRNAKLKIDRNTSIDCLEAIVNENPGITFGVDANGSLDLEDSKQISALDAMGLSYIEQPGRHDDLDGHRRLRAHIDTPIALDESASSVDAIRQILGANAADIINLKTGRFGTLGTIALAKEVIGSGCQVRLGGLVESGIGRAHTIAVATTELFSTVGDIAGSDRYFADDLVRPQHRVRDGYVTTSDAPGIGTVDLGAVETAAVGHLSVA